MYYNAQVVSVSDYYPFGMLIKEREWKDSSFSYRFGFNGYEREDDIAGQGSVIDFGARIYDSRLGRFFSRDPIVYPYWSPYQYDANSPISVKDILGMGTGDDPPMTTKKLKSGDTPGAVAGSNNMSLKEFAKANPDKYSGENFEDEQLWDKKNWTFQVGAEVNVKDNELIEFESWPEVLPSSTPAGNRKTPHAKSVTKSGASTGYQVQTIAFPETLTDLVDAGLSGAEVSYLMGALQNDIRQESEFKELQFKIVLTALMDERYGKEPFRFGQATTSLITLGAQSLGTDGALDRVTWTLNHAQIKYMVWVNQTGDISVSYRMWDRLDLREGNRSWLYNATVGVLGEKYHDVSGGNDQMQTRVLLTDFYKH
jgi:RHS repeat-associated protein